MLCWYWDSSSSLIFLSSSPACPLYFGYVSVKLTKTSDYTKRPKTQMLFYSGLSSLTVTNFSIVWPPNKHSSWQTYLWWLLGANLLMALTLKVLSKSPKNLWQTRASVFEQREWKCEYSTQRVQVVSKWPGNGSLCLSSCISQQKQTKNPSYLLMQHFCVCTHFILWYRTPTA